MRRTRSQESSLMDNNLGKPLPVGNECKWAGPSLRACIDYSASGGLTLNLSLFVRSAKLTAGAEGTASDLICGFERDR